ncbi:MauE/DoxX family redox-associated membrane protein [Kiritimatiella glycovorans]|uniref:Methylamine utilization protein MauE n=1 Tax=Kiritimatiella glycovorans TaxID=1307763 RepID=A0A0G3EEY0_9BACT|nr:MauE/DoxX family redox-associated membrane protein [Kiritimatiella glycovorans]AKJ64873.1 Methylamine utilization protein MauE [Kiritimatiella glycovorans]
MKKIKRMPEGTGAAGRMAVLVAWIMATLFLYSGVVKIADPPAFARALFRYRLLPDAAVNPAALWIPWIEVLAGGALFFSHTRRAGLFLLLGLMTVFTAAVTVLLVRGKSIPCGCFDPTGGMETGWVLLIRNAAIMIVLAGLFFRGERRTRA